MKRRIFRIVSTLILLALIGFLVYSLITHKVSLKSLFEKKGDPMMSDATFTYDGEYHALEVQNLKRGMTATYEVNYGDETHFRDVGEYEYTAWVYDKSGKLVDYMTAYMTIVPKEIFVVVDPQISDHGEFLPQGYTVDGLVEGDVLEGYISYDEAGNVVFDHDNPNYSVTAIGGERKYIIDLVNTIGFHDFDITVRPPLMPVTFMETDMLENCVVTSVTFVLGGLIENYDEDNLNFIFYIVDEDLTRTREECTVENGRKIVVDISEQLQRMINEGYGDGRITIDGLNIRLGKDETLAFGDTDMQFSIALYRGRDDDPLIRSVFDSPVGSMHSLPMIIEGYKILGGGS